MPRSSTETAEQFPPQPAAGRTPGASSGDPTPRNRPPRDQQPRASWRQPSLAVPYRAAEADCRAKHLAANRWLKAFPWWSILPCPCLICTTDLRSGPQKLRPRTDATTDQAPASPRDGTFFATIREYLQLLSPLD